MTDVERGVDADAAVECGEVLGEGLEAVERDAAQRGGVHALDPGEKLDEPVRIARPQGRHREPAIAGDHGRDAVEATRRGVRLERELRVVVRVRIDDARGDDPAVGIELTGARTVDEADLGDPAAGDGDVGAAPRKPGAVHDDAVADHQVVGGHDCSD